MSAVLSERGTVDNMKASIELEVPYFVYYQDLKNFNLQGIHKLVCL